jgi:MFS family permease
LLASSWTSNLGDGIAVSAGPLLIASQTRDPRIVALATLLQYLPWLLFSLYAGAIADRLDRRLIVVVVDLARAGVLAVLATTVITDTVSIAVVLTTLFIVGTAEVFADTTSQTLLPTILDRDHLAIGNARITMGFVTVNQLAGPAIGAALFAAGMALPFVTQAVLVAAGAVLVSRVVVPSRAHTREHPKRIRVDIVDGFSWVIHNAAVRTLILTILIFNVTFGAAWSVLVLYAKERLGLGPVGFGLLTSISAVGGIAGTSAYGWITRRVSLGNIMRAGLIVETFTHLALALTTTPAVAMVIFFFFGAHAFIWGTTSITVRQRAVPIDLQGRVGSVNGLGVFGGLVIGAGIGGLVAGRWGVTAPFWFAFVGSGIFVLLIWRQLRYIAHEDERERPAEPAGTTATEP